MSTRIHNLEISINGGRISRSEQYLAIAEIISLRSTCCRGKNGAVVTQDHRIVSTGYNGTIIPHMDCGGLGCDVTKKCVHAMHAERNAIAFAARNGISLDGATIYCTSSPCYDCAMMIVQAGIKIVMYKDEYKTDGGAGLNLLKACGIETYQK